MRTVTLKREEKLRTFENEVLKEICT